MTLPLKVHSLLSNSKTSLSAPSPEYASSPSTANSGVKLYELATPRLAVVSAMSPPKPAPRNGVNVQRDSDDGCASADDESSSTVANVRAIVEIFRMSPSSGETRCKQGTYTPWSGRLAAHASSRVFKPHREIARAPQAGPSHVESC